MTVYPTTANGNAAPTRTITGPATGLDNPFGVTVVDGVIYVSNQSTPSLTMYPATAA